MDKNSTVEKEFKQELQSYKDKMPEKYYHILVSFFACYEKAVKPFERAIPVVRQFMRFVAEQIKSPYSFEPYHQKIRTPFDYYRFGINFIAPLCDLAHSHVEGMKNLEKIAQALKRKENVVLLANHQTETDPQAIAILVEKTHPEIASSMIYVAGERVVTDPLAIPLSMGCDLLCIYSKRYIDHPPELKGEKQLHNKKTMELMSRLLQEGGKIIYVAPSGGRDRKNDKGEIEVAPFDPDSVEMFYLMAKKSKTVTHFVPFALSTYELMPPPDTIQRELGEQRTVHHTPIHLYFGPFFDMENFPGSELQDKKQRREAKARAIWSIVNENYKKLC